MHQEKAKLIFEKFEYVVKYLSSLVMSLYAYLLSFWFVDKSSDDRTNFDSIQEVITPLDTEAALELISTFAESDGARLSLAILHHRGDVALALIREGIDLSDQPQLTFLWQAINKANIIGNEFALALIDALIDQGLDINKCKTVNDGYENSTLSAAISYGQTEIAFALINKGADLNAGRNSSRVQSKESSLHLAINKRNKVIALALIDKGADLSTGKVVDDKTHSNLWSAIHTDQEDVALAIINKGADLDAGKVELNGKTYSNLWLAIDQGQIEIALALIGAGANLCVDSYNRGIENLDIAKALIERLYCAKGFPSLMALSMFSLKRPINTNQVPERVAEKIDSYKSDKEFLIDQSARLNPLSEQVAETLGVPPEAMSMFIRHN